MPRKLLNVDDYRRLAKRRLPKVVFEYIDGGSEDESTVQGNRAAYEQIWLRPRVGYKAGAPNLSTTIAGVDISMPIICAPCGAARIAHPAGDLAAARAAANAGTIHCLATRSGHSIEELGEGSDGPKFFQVYNIHGLSAVERALAAAQSHGFRAVIITFDTQTVAKREKDLRNGRAELLGAKKIPSALPYVPQLMMKPRWFAHRIRDGLVPDAPNLRVDETENVGYTSPVFGGSLGWDDVAWVRARWDGPIFVKGVLTKEDACRAAQTGVDGVIISNHGGRQLNGALPTVQALPEIAAAVGDQIEVLLDGGIRRGTDVIKALSLGAKAVLVGRPWMFGLGADGQAGVEAVLNILRTELELNLTLMDCSDVAELDGDCVRVPPEWLSNAGRDLSPEQSIAAG
jgi:isopentenyl diphosphate isomerase/L-lactate dehydrogenase-like FMN-dependent dehydrogenase